MSNSNYSVGLQRLKPVHTAYCGLHNLAKNWSGARDVNGRDRDETETLTIFLETRSIRDVGRSRDRDVETETTTLARRGTELEQLKCSSVKYLHYSISIVVTSLYSWICWLERYKWVITKIVTVGLIPCIDCLWMKETFGLWTGAWE